MAIKSPTQLRVLGLAPSSRGLGFAVMTETNTLIDWGVKPVKSGNKNERTLANAAELISRYRPNLIAIEESEGSRRGSRVQELIQEIIILAGDEEINVKRFSRKNMNVGILQDEGGTKHTLAQHLALRFPEELSFRLPKKRRLWTSESYQMDIFQAVALAQYSLISGGNTQDSRRRKKDSSRSDYPTDKYPLIRKNAMNGIV